MRLRNTLCTSLAALFTCQYALAGGGRGGIDDPRAVQQQLQQNMDSELIQQIQQMDQLTEQILGNMQRAGENAGEFRQQMDQQMSEGTLDVPAVEQEMVDRGYMTPAMVQQINAIIGQVHVGLQRTMLNTTFARIKQLLRPSDDEWAILEPKVERILNAQATLARPGENDNKVLGIGGANREGPLTPGLYFLSTLGSGEPDTDLGRARQALDTAVANRQTSESTLAERLRTLRAEQQKAHAELKAARDDLTRVLTLRQEAVMMIVGVL